MCPTSVYFGLNGVVPIYEHFNRAKVYSTGVHGTFGYGTDVEHFAVLEVSQQIFRVSGGLSIHMLAGSNWFSKEVAKDSSGCKLRQLK